MEWCSGHGATYNPHYLSDWLGEYCSVECQTIFHKRKKLKEPKEYFCVVCKTAFVSSRAFPRYCSKDCRLIANAERAKLRSRKHTQSLPRQKIIDCRWCDKPLALYRDEVTNRFPQTVYHAACRIKAKRNKDRVKSVRRQNARTDVARIDVDDIAERDDFICHICNEIVDMSLSRKSQMGATVDHVFPLSLGGLDSLDNVKLAHWVCNVKKSNKVGVDIA